MRKVHDVWRLSRRFPQAKCAIVQWGNPDEGYAYEVVCPYCGKTCGWVDDRDDDHSELSLRMYARRIMREHIVKCEFPVSTALEVEVVRSIPGVRRIPEMM